MSASRFCLVAAALGCLLAPASKADAQAYGMADFVDHTDLNWFEPNELDLDGRMEPKRGYYFSYEKLAWAFTAERIEIGSPGLEVDSENPFPFDADEQTGRTQFRVDELTLVGFTPEDLNAIFGYEFVTDDMGDIVFITRTGFDDEGNQFTFQSPQLSATTFDQAFQSYNVQNGIQDAVPEASLGWGDRYEFGYNNGERGWRIGVLDGPVTRSEGVYGAGTNHPFDSLTDGNGAGQDNFYQVPPASDDVQGGGPVNEFLALGFGSVAVNFQLPDETNVLDANGNVVGNTYLTGFRDYMQNINPNVTVYGPINFIGSFGAIVDSNDFDDDEVVQIIDDIDGDLDGGFTFIVADLDGDGTIDEDEILSYTFDLDDAYTFNVFFDQVELRNRVEMDGVEWMLTHQIDQSHRLEQGRRDSLEFSYGVRFVRLEDEFSFLGLGSILGRTGVRTDIENQIVGPQVGLRYTRDRGKWDFTFDGRCLFGFNAADLDQNGVFGEELIPGAANRPAVGRTTTSVYGERFDEFSPVAELRVEARYKLTKALSVKVGYNAQYIANIHRASRATLYNAPDFGYADDSSDILVNGVTLGVEINR
ncbi:MAG: BBP7 family outer membrane beta-barrel protein [Planctomycetota bacterium]